MGQMSVVREQLGELLGHDPEAWLLVDIVLDVVETHLVHIAAHGPASEIARAAVARGLPPATSLGELLADERSTGRIVAVRDVFDEVIHCRRKAQTARRALSVASAVARSNGFALRLLVWLGLR